LSEHSNTEEEVEEEVPEKYHHWLLKILSCITFL
jgi:hypothetical protein